MMPGLDGFALLRAVRSDPQDPHAPGDSSFPPAPAKKCVSKASRPAPTITSIKPFTANELRARVGTHMQMAIARRNRPWRAKLSFAPKPKPPGIGRSTYLKASRMDLSRLDRGLARHLCQCRSRTAERHAREEMLGKGHWDLFPGGVGTYTSGAVAGWRRTAYRSNSKITTLRGSAGFT